MIKKKKTWKIMTVKKKKKSTRILTGKMYFYGIFFSFFNYKFYSYIKTKNFRTTTQSMRVLNSPAHAFFLPALPHSTLPMKFP